MFWVLILSQFGFFWWGPWKRTWECHLQKDIDFYQNYLAHQVFLFFFSFFSCLNRIVLDLSKNCLLIKLNLILLQSNSFMSTCVFLQDDDDTCEQSSCGLVGDVMKLAQNWIPHLIPQIINGPLHKMFSEICFIFHIDS